MNYVTPLPSPPSTLSPEDFDPKADAFVFALTRFVQEFNSTVDDVNFKVDQVTFPKYLGAFAADPVVKPNGQPLEIGNLYFNTSTSSVRAFTSTGWTSTTTPTPVSFTLRTFDGNGALKNFELSPVPYSSTAAFVFVGGQIKILGVDYMIDANGVLMFTVAPPTGVKNVVVYIFSPVNYGVPDDNSITAPKIRNQAVTTEKFAPTAKAPLAGVADSVRDDSIESRHVRANSLLLSDLLRVGSNRQVLSSNGLDSDAAYRTLREVCRVGGLGSFGAGDTVYSPMTALDIDGYPIVWGRTDQWVGTNQFNNGDQPPRRAILNVPLPPNVMFVKSVSTVCSSYLIASNGWVYSTGNNTFGQLGHGDTLQRDIYTRIEFFISNALSIVDVVTSGSRVSFSTVTSVYFRTSTGRVYACGYNVRGQLGIGNLTESIPNPTLISPNLSDVVDIAVCSNNEMSTYIRTANGSLFVAGRNSRGQLGIGNLVDQSTFVQTNLANVVEVSSTGGYSDSNFSSYASHAIAKLANGTVLAAGFNAFGQLGLGDTNNRSSFQPITTPSVLSKIQACGGYYGLSLGFGANGALYTWGYNGQGAIGDNTLVNRNRPYQVLGYNSLTASFPTANPPFNGKIAKVLGSISAVGGFNRVLVLDTDGNLWYAGHDYAYLTGSIQQNIPRYTQAYLPIFYEPGEKIIDIVEHGFDGQALRYFALTNMGHVYGVGSNENALCTGSRQSANSPTFIKSLNRINLG